MTAPLHFLILYSESGVGHRSVAMALRHALLAESGDCQVEIVDGLTEYTPFPFNRLPAWYPHMVSSAMLPVWGKGFQAIDDHRRMYALTNVAWPYIRRRFRRLLTDYQIDIIISVHPILTTIAARLGTECGVPMVVVVSDPVSVHALWFPPGAALYLVGTEKARQSALRYAIPPERVQVTGMPTRLDFDAPCADKLEARKHLQWAPELPTVLLMNGGDGIGPIFEIARAIATSSLYCQLVVVTGRNARLCKKMRAVLWEIPTHVYGFVVDLDMIMKAADVIVSKAGASTVWEALNVGVPILFSNYLSGHEDGNVDYVVAGGAGRQTPGPEAVVDALRELFEEPSRETLRRMAENACRIAHPNAARNIARATLAVAQEKRAMFAHTLEAAFR